MMDNKLIYKTMKEDFQGVKMVGGITAAKILRISVSTLDKMRYSRCGIEYKKIDDKILYPLYSLAVYIS